MTITTRLLAKKTLWQRANSRILMSRDVHFWAKIFYWKTNMPNTSITNTPLAILLLTTTVTFRHTALGSGGF